MKPVTGAAIDRADGPLKVRGAARFAAEFDAPRLAHAVLVRSTIPSGAITSIDTSAAEKSPGVALVLTARNAIRLDQGKPDPPVSRALSLLQDEVVHYNGEPIAVVVADTLEQARAAAALVRARYREEPARLDFEALAKSEAYKPEKMVRDPPDKDWGDAAAALDGAAVTIDQVYTTPWETHNPLEPHATLAQWEGDKLTVHDSTQYVFGARNTLAKLFKLERSQVRVVAPFTGGGFGSKGSAWSHVALAAMAAKKTGRPVKLALDRPQMFGPVGHRPRTIQRVALGAQRDGRLVALVHELTSSSTVMEVYTEQAATLGRMLYACENGRTAHRLVKLNLGVPTFMRAPGLSTGNFALECALDELAAELKIDPLALRLKNHAERAPASCKAFSSKKLRECYEQGAARFGWNKRHARREHGELVGFGMATATYPAHRQKSAALARLLPDGSAQVQAATHELGTGTYTVMAQVAADVLGLPVARIDFQLGDTLLPEAPLSAGSMTVASVAPAVREACIEARDALIELALRDAESPLHGASRENVVAADGFLALAKQPGKRDSFAAVLARNGGGTIEKRAEAKPAQAEGLEMHTFGAVFAEVRVDAELGVLRVPRIHGTYGVGRLLNAKTAHSQLLGGIVWGVGMALHEHSELDPKVGRFVNANLVEYHVPCNADIESVDIAFVDENDTAVNELGAKGVGEIGICGVAAAIANAVYDATGKRVRDLPITLDKLV
jgi:xanthine dehydrogenase YagR molybdenum-binding subunit